MSHGDSLRSQKKSDHAVPAAAPRRAADAAAAGDAPAAPGSLDAAYRATSYQAVLPEALGGRLEIRIDASHPLVDAWLDRVGVDCWSYLCAENPGSRRLAPADNACRTARLRRRLEECGRPFLAGRAVADDGCWPPEASFLVGGVDEAAARELAALCEQNAFVCGRRGGIARLVWLRRGG